MDALIQWILNGSTTLNVEVLVRLIIIMMALEIFAVACGFLGRLH